MEKDQVDLYNAFLNYSYSQLKELFKKAKTKDEQDFYIKLSNLVLQKEQAKVIGNSLKTYTIFAGVNGAGKTSMYKAIYYNENKDEKRINTDEMVARLGSWQDNSLQFKCAREAVKLIKKYISEGVSFNQETTLSGKSIIRNIEVAKQNGYYVVVNYIGVSSPEVAKERVRIRVENGGHGIPDEDIERRYYDSIENLKKILHICNEINIYDNTEMLKEVIYFENGKIKWVDMNLPEWIQSILKR